MVWRPNRLLQAACNKIFALSWNSQTIPFRHKFCHPHRSRPNARPLPFSVSCSFVLQLTAPFLFLLFPHLWQFCMHFSPLQIPHTPYPIPAFRATPLPAPATPCCCLHCHSCRFFLQLGRALCFCILFAFPVLRVSQSQSLGILERRRHSLHFLIACLGSKWVGYCEWLFKIIFRIKNLYSRFTLTNFLNNYLKSSNFPRPCLELRTNFLPLTTGSCYFENPSSTCTPDSYNLGTFSNYAIK